MAGRPPKPIALKTGTITKEETTNRLEQEQKIKGRSNKVYRVPKELKKEVADIYKVIVTELKEADILNNLDIELIATTSYAIYRMKEARAILDKEGAVMTLYKEIDGEPHPTNVIKHPAVNVEKDYQAIFHAGCIQLGLSPSSRAKLTLINVEADKQDTKEDKVFG